MFKLIFFIFFLLIFVNISTGKSCKNSKSGENKINLRRHKRGSKDCEESSIKQSDLENLQLVEGEEEKVKEINKSRKRALYICDNFFYSHTKFNTLLANILSEEYQMDVIVYSRSAGGHPVDPENVNLLINVPINENLLNQKVVEEKGIVEAFQQFRYTYNFIIGIYEEIISNKQVKIGEEMVAIYDWLIKQKYSFGIAEFNFITGPFAVFEALGIENTFNVSASVFFPVHLQFLGIDVTRYKVPDFNSSLPGDWLNKEGLLENGSKRYKENLFNNLDNNKDNANFYSQTTSTIFNSFFNKSNVNDLKLPSPMEFLFKKIKLHFANQPLLLNFKEFPTSENIIYIGGLLVEQNKLLTMEKVKVEDNEPPCVVLITFGTVNITGSLDLKSMTKMFREFGKHKHCLFKARLNDFVPKKYNKEIIKVTDEILPQKEILAKENTKLFISHCGQNSLTEAIYAGVPLICIPYNGDQFYLSSLVEHLGIGIYVKLKVCSEHGVDSVDFGVDFRKALNKMMKKNNIYQKTVNELRTKILHDLKENGPKKDIFLQKISEVISK